jgi:hypothetical protein
MAMSDQTQMHALFGRVLSGRINEESRLPVEQLAHSSLHAVPPRGGMDGIEDFACLLPFLVMADMMGIPLKARSTKRVVGLS